METKRAKIYAQSMIDKYSTVPGGKVDKLKALDKKVSAPVEITAYSIGIASSLVAGVGMCLSMNVIGSGNLAAHIIGYIVGILGFAGMAVNFPIYKKYLGTRKQMYADQVKELAASIVNG